LAEPAGNHPVIPAQLNADGAVDCRAPHYEDLTVTYSTNIASDPNQVLAVEYRVSNRLSFVAQYEQGSQRNLSTRNNNYSFEIRMRKRSEVEESRSTKQNAEGRRHKAEGLPRFCFLPTAHCLCLLFFHWLTPRSAITKAGPSLLSMSCSKARLPIQLRKASSRNLKVVAGGEILSRHVRQSLHDLYASGRVARRGWRLMKQRRRSFSADSSSLRVQDNRNRRCHD